MPLKEHISYVYLSPGQASAGGDIGGLSKSVERAFF
jgi:hypothetical protein